MMWTHMQPKVMHQYKFTTEFCTVVRPNVRMIPMSKFNIDQKFKQLFNDLPGERFPSKECVMVHLFLLEAFHSLEHTIKKTDGLFGLYDNMEVQDASSVNSSSLELIQEKRWRVFVLRAVERYELWWDHVLDTERVPLTSNKLKSGYFYEWVNSAGMFMSDITLPPLDVLMVWHTHMMSSKVYLEDCFRQGLNKIWGTEFPWQHVRRMLDMADGSYTYNPPTETREYFEKKTGCKWENLDDPETKLLHCFNCGEQKKVKYVKPRKISGNNVITFDRDAYVEPDMVVPCSKSPDSEKLCHWNLAFRRFLKDLKKYEKLDRPVAGTILSIDANLPLTSESSERVNKVLRSGSLLGKLYEWYFQHEENNPLQGFQGIFSHIASEYKRLFGRDLTTMDPDYKVVQEIVHKRYQSGNTNFGTNLVEDVICQGQFIDQMHGQYNLNSTFLSATIDRALHQYQRVVCGTSLTRTESLDVELTWYIHQMMPKQYLLYCVAEKGRLVNHGYETDLGLPQGFSVDTADSLDHYGDCECWYCKVMTELQSIAV